MKKISIIILLILSTTILFGQKVKPSDVPESVKSAFKSMFADAKPRSWEKEKFNLYNVEFMWKGEETYATFNANGYLMRTAVEIKKSELNKKITDHAKELYPDYKLKEAIKITTTDKKIFYQLEIKKRKDIKNLVFKETGEYMGEDIYETLNMLN